MVRWILLSAAAIAVGGASLYSLNWNRALQLPSWYHNRSQKTTPALARSTVPQHNAKTGQDLSERNFSTAIPPAVEQQLQRQKDSGNGTLELTAADTNAWLKSSIAQTPDYKALQPAIRGINTEIKQGQVTSGLVIDTRQLSMQNLSPALRRSLESTFTQFPMLKDRELYIGLIGSPRIENNRLIPNEETKLQLGNLSMPLPQAMKLLGVSPQQLDIPVDSKAWNLNVQNAQVKEDKLVLKGEIVP